MRNNAEQYRPLQPPTRFATVFGQVVVGVLAGMTIFEIVKSLLFPEITLWQSHRVTIMFSGWVSGIAVFVVYRRQE